MSDPKCPRCQFPYTRLLPDTSKDPVVDFYRCYGCGYVWHLPMNHPDGLEDLGVPHMVVPPCPRCQALTVRHVEATSRGAAANFFRCAACGNVWAVPKNPSRLPAT